MAARKTRKAARSTGSKRPTPSKWEIQQVDVDQLHFDVKNPRLVELHEDASEDEVLQVLWREMAVDEVALSVAENGFFEHEPLFATREHGDLVVIEGNRRLAAVKLLRDPDLRMAVGATDLPRITAAQRTRLARLPVIVSERRDLWQFIGFKHVNGPQSWDSFAKAKYIAWVHTKLRVPLDQIAHQIGDRHDTVRRLNHGYLVLEQAEREGVFSRDDRWKNHFSFSHLYTGLSYPGIQAFLGTSAKSDKADPVPKRKVKSLGQLCQWLYGQKSKNVRPVVQSQNPDLRILDEILQDEKATAALSSGLPLATAHDVSKGDERMFREALQLAKKSLQDAHGTLLTGYAGSRGDLDTADDILNLAERLVEEMHDYQASRTARKARRRKS